MLEKTYTKQNKQKEGRKRLSPISLLAGYVIWSAGLGCLEGLLEDAQSKEERFENCVVGAITGPFMQSVNISKSAGLIDSPKKTVNRLE